MNILTLPTPFVTPRRIALPSRDAFGIPHGIAYAPFRKASDISLATRASFGGIKIRRVHEALSLNELRAMLAFNFNPYVVDIRDQYPVYDQEDYNRAKRNGMRMPINRVMTYDIVLTVVLPPDCRLHYHGISIKDAGDELTQADWNRQKREQDIFRERNWTWELLRGNQFTRRAYGNHSLMKTWIANVDVWNHYEEAVILAARLKTRSQRGTLDDILNRHARHMGISCNHAFELFSTAVSFGHLYIDHSKDLRVDKPLHLERYEL
ncbi:TnsA endonuclease N-terminal domain-containing protein [Burkholderia multivorans]|uniref:TnsA endonuclease N-terminal domain-containing protein n=1 Tax=Burkholderia multivorans TaxID=87883 RepID=UPI000AFB0375|nr:TnsA endonuclease N-terminal domain-containing protein [Burkholderia multivorans]